MKNIDGKQYYTLEEVVDIVKTEAGIKLSLNNSTRQWFYRMKLPKIEGGRGKHHLYREDGIKQVVDYHKRKKRIRELIKELNGLRSLNTKFIGKYKWKW